MAFKCKQAFTSGPHVKGINPEDLAVLSCKQQNTDQIRSTPDGRNTVLTTVYVKLCFGIGPVKIMAELNYRSDRAGRKRFLLLISINSLNVLVV